MSFLVVDHVTPRKTSAGDGEDRQPHRRREATTIGHLFTMAWMVEAHFTQKQGVQRA
jgi:hypothetical protein